MIISSLSLIAPVVGVPQGRTCMFASTSCAIALRKVRSVHPTKQGGGGIDTFACE